MTLGCLFMAEFNVQISVLRSHQTAKRSRGPMVPLSCGNLKGVSNDTA
jgi:hypothetical protein